MDFAIANTQHYYRIERFFSAFWILPPGGAFALSSSFVFLIFYKLYHTYLKMSYNKSLKNGYIEISEEVSMLCGSRRVTPARTV